MSVKTLVVFSDYQSLPVFYVLDGDKRNWHGVIVNAGYEPRTGHDGLEVDYTLAEQEICATLFPADMDGRQLEPTATQLAKAIQIATEDGPNFFTAVCGFAP